MPPRSTATPRQWRAWERRGTRSAWGLGDLAEMQLITGRAADALQTIGGALALAETSGQRFYDAGLYRLRGECFLALEEHTAREAEAAFREALEIARSQQARSLEIRAALSLARLWQQQGKRTDARDLLQPVYAWFTEGFDTRDLVDAKTLLEELEA